MDLIGEMCIVEVLVVAAYLVRCVAMTNSISEFQAAATRRGHVAVFQREKPRPSALFYGPIKFKSKSKRIVISQ